MIPSNLLFRVLHMSDRRSFLKSLLGFPLVARFGAGRAGQAASSFSMRLRSFRPGFLSRAQAGVISSPNIVSEELSEWLHAKSEVVESPSFEYVELKPDASVDISQCVATRGDDHLSKAYLDAPVDAPVDDPAVTVLPPVDPYEDVDLNLLETSFSSSNPDLNPSDLEGVDEYVSGVPYDAEFECKFMDTLTDEMIDHVHEEIRREFEGDLLEPAYDQASETFSYVVDQSVNITPDD